MNADTQIALRECPFANCDGKAAFEVDTEDFDICRVVCTKCGSCGPFIDLDDIGGDVERAKTQAADRWNTRPLPPQSTIAAGAIGDHDETLRRMALASMNHVRSRHALLPLRWEDFTKTEQCDALARASVDLSALEGKS